MTLKILIRAVTALPWARVETEKSWCLMLTSSKFQQDMTLDMSHANIDVLIPSIINQPVKFLEGQFHLQFETKIKRKLFLQLFLKDY